MQSKVRSCSKMFAARTISTLTTNLRGEPARIISERCGVLAGAVVTLLSTGSEEQTVSARPF